MQELLDVQSLEKTFDGSRWILQDLDFKLNVGDCAVIRGENGSGKSTLMKVLATALKPTHGHIHLKGHSLTELPQEVRPLIGFSDSESGFYPQLTGLENLEIAAQLHRIPRAQWLTVCNEWKDCKTFLLSLTNPYSVCSQGMKQILNVFLAFAKKPKLFLFDESHNGLDEATLQFVTEKLKIALPQSAAIMTSHTDFCFKNETTKKYRIENGKLAPFL